MAAGLAGGAGMLAPASAAQPVATVVVRVGPGPSNLPVSYTPGVLRVDVLPPDPCHNACIAVGPLLNITFLPPGPCSSSNAVAGLPACEANK